MFENDLHKIIEKKRFGDANLILRVEKKDKFFNPGQFFSVGMPDLPINREYSVSNSSDDDFIEFIVRYVNEGTLTPYLFDSKIGDKLKILGAYGEFYLENFDLDKEYIFFGTGTGVAPFISIIKSHKLKKFKIYHGVREVKDAINDSILNLDNYELYVTREEIKKSDNIHQGRINKYFDEIMKDYNKNQLFFLCGNSLMVSEIHELLIKKQIDNDKIFTEIFF